MRSKLPNTQTSIFSQMSALAKTHGALNLSQGFPNFKSDPLLIDLVSKAMTEGFNQYAPMPGDVGLREVICDKIYNLYNRQYNPESEITITAGATQAIFTTIAALIHPGDEVIVFTPAYDCYEPAISLQGATTVSVQLKAPAYKVDWQEVSQAVNDKTRMIIVNTPHNPCGSVFSKDDMLTLERLVEAHDLLVLSDEVYEHIIFDAEEHQSAARFDALAQRTIIVASFGKTFHNTGWKMGYCVAPKTLMTEIRKVHQYNVFSVNHPIQKALAQYLLTPSHYLELGSFYQAKRDFFVNGLSETKFNIIPSKGTYFQLLDISELTTLGDVEYARYLTKEHKIASIPTSVFNKDKADHRMLRFCFAKTTATLEQAISILTKIGA
ncbi:MAG: methionine aminotransferase [Gilvibacter sp.]